LNSLLIIKAAIKLIIPSRMITLYPGIPPGGGLGVGVSFTTNSLKFISVISRKF